MASDLDLWWVLLDGETKTSPSPATGLSGAGLAVEAGGEGSRLLLWCRRWQRRLDGDESGLSETDCDLGPSDREEADGLRSSDKMSFRSFVPLE